MSLTSCDEDQMDKGSMTDENLTSSPRTPTFLDNSQHKLSPPLLLTRHPTIEEKVINNSYGDCQRLDQLHKSRENGQVDNLDFPRTTSVTVEGNHRDEFESNDVSEELRRRRPRAHSFNESSFPRITLRPRFSKKDSQLATVTSGQDLQVMDSCCKCFNCGNLRNHTKSHQEVSPIERISTAFKTQAQHAQLHSFDDHNKDGSPGLTNDGFFISMSDMPPPNILGVESIPSEFEMSVAKPVPRHRHPALLANNTLYEPRPEGTPPTVGNLPLALGSSSHGTGITLVSTSSTSAFVPTPLNRTPNTSSPVEDFNNDNEWLLTSVFGTKSEESLDCISLNYTDDLNTKPMLSPTSFSLPKETKNRAKIEKCPFDEIDSGNFFKPFDDSQRGQSSTVDLDRTIRPWGSRNCLKRCRSHDTLVEQTHSTLLSKRFSSPLLRTMSSPDLSCETSRFSPQKSKPTNYYTAPIRRRKSF